MKFTDPYTFGNSRAAVYLNDILKVRPRPTQEKVSARLVRVNQMIRECVNLDLSSETRHVLQKGFLEIIDAPNKDISKLEMCLMRNITLAKLRNTRFVKTIEQRLHEE